MKGSEASDRAVGRDARRKRLAAGKRTPPAAGGCEPMAAAGAGARAVEAVVTSLSARRTGGTHAEGRTARRSRSAGTDLVRGMAGRAFVPITRGTEAASYP